MKRDFKQRKSTASVNKSNQFKVPWWLIAALIIISFIVYQPILKNNFLNWDDNLYITENPDIHGINTDNAKAWFTKSYVSTYLPITMFSYAMNYMLGGLNPERYIFTNFFLHMLNACLVFWLVLLLLKNTPYECNAGKHIIPFLSAFLFAIHPVNVESVAWQSERKNVLFAFFFLMAIISYFKYLDKAKTKYYIFSLLLFLLSVLSKGVAVSLPLCLIAVDIYYKRSMFSIKVIVEKIPFLIVSLVFGIVTIKSQQVENSLVGAVDFPFYKQLAFASYGFINYLINLCLPFNLSAYYSYPQDVTAVHWACLGITTSIVVLFVLFFKKINRLALFSILFYLACIVFLIQIIPVGNALLADRYIYLSSIGFFVIFSMLVFWLYQKSKFILIPVTILIFVYIGFTRQQIKIWHNSLSFWDDVIKHDTHIPRAWNNRGVVKKDLGDYQGALSDFTNAIQVMPEYPEAYNNRGIAKYYLNQPLEAIADFNQAIHFDSLYADAYYNRGTVYNTINNAPQALSDLSKAITLNPHKREAFINRANIYIKLSKYQEAVQECTSALAIFEDDNVYALRGLSYTSLSQFDKSISDFSKAINLKPNDINYYHNRGVAYYYSNKFEQAVNNMNMVLQNNGDMAVSYYIRGMAFAKMGKQKSACNDLQTAINKGFSAAASDLNIFCK